MAQGQQSAVADAPDTLPGDFFDRKNEEAPDTLPGDFFDKKANAHAPSMPEGSYQNRKGGPVLNINERPAHAAVRAVEGTLGITKEPQSFTDALGQSARSVGNLGLSIAKDPLNAGKAVEGIATGLESGAKSVYEGVKRHDPRSVAYGTGEIGGTLGQGEATEKVERAGEALGRHLPSADSIGLAARTEKGALKPKVKAVSRFAGAALGHATTIPGMGEVGGFIMGPSLADAIIPARPYDIPTKGQSVGAPLPDADTFYLNRGRDLTTRGRQQEILDRKAAQAAPKPSPFAGATSSADAIGAPIELPAPRPQQPFPAIRTKAEVAAANAPAKPSIVTPEPGPRVESEGRPATWTNEKVLELAAKGNRAAIAQVGVRQLPMPPNARYVAGDVDYRNLITSPREVTRFAPDGKPIRQEAHQPIGRTIDSVATASRSAKPGTPEPESNSRGLNFEQSIAVPSERPLPPAEAPPESIGTPVNRPHAPEPESIGEPIPEEEPVPVEVKGITASEKPPRVRAEKPVPIEKRFSPDAIVDAEGLLHQESGAMLSADRPGVYYDENQLGDYNPQKQQSSARGVTSGGRWRGVSSGRDMHPFMREHPEWGPEAVQKALRNKDSAAYRKMMEAAIEFVNRGKDVETAERAAIQDEPIGSVIDNDGFLSEVEQPTNGDAIGTPIAERRSSIRDVAGPDLIRTALAQRLRAKLEDLSLPDADRAIIEAQLDDLKAHPFERHEGGDINSMKGERTVSREEAEANTAKRKEGRNKRFSR